MNRRLLRMGILGLAVFLGGPGAARGALLDWGSVAWTAGALTASYDIDASNPGNDVTVTISGNTGRLVAGFPANDQILTGGLSPVENALHSRVNFSGTTQTLTVTVAFNYAQGVSGVSFDLFNIDRSGTTYVDQIRTIQATAVGGGLVAATITGSANNTVAGSGLSQTVTGTAVTANNSGAGNASIDFGANAVTQFQFTFGSGAGSQANPAQQNFSLHDVNFTPVPEAGVVWGTAGICLLAMGLHLVRLRREQAAAAPVRKP